MSVFVPVVTTAQELGSSSFDRYLHSSSTWVLILLSLLDDVITPSSKRTACDLFCSMAIDIQLQYCMTFLDMKVA